MEILGRGFIASHLRPLEDRHPDAVVLAAGVSSAASTSQDDFRREAELLETVIERCERTGRRLVFFSTASAGMYGPLNREGREDGPVFPHTPYGGHKLELERTIRKSGIDHLILRISHLVGPGQRPHQLIPALILQMSSGRVRIHRGAHRDLIDIADVVRLVDRLLEIGISREVVNVASGVPFPVERIIDQIEQEIGRAAEHDYVDLPSDYPPVSIEKLRTLVPDIVTRTFGPDYPITVLDRYVGVLTRVYFDSVGGDGDDK